MILHRAARRLNDFGYAAIIMIFLLLLLLVLVALAFWLSAWLFIWPPAFEWTWTYWERGTSTVSFDVRADVETYSDANNDDDDVENISGKLTVLPLSKCLNWNVTPRTYKILVNRINNAVGVERRPRNRPRLLMQFAMQFLVFLEDEDVHVRSFAFIWAHSMPSTTSDFDFIFVFKVIQAARHRDTCTGTVGLLLC